MPMHKTLFAALAAALSAQLAFAAPVYAMCGCFVPRIPRSGPAGETRTLPNKATVVSLMREGTKTVLSFQNDYHGPPEDFALVVPVPIVLQQGDVKTLDRGVFDRMQAVSAPRLVEVWERDPCEGQGRARGAGLGMLDAMGRGGGAMRENAAATAAPPPPVVVENQFSEGEFDIVVLGATDSAALETWLRTNGYAIPNGASAVFNPYVQAGMKWFVARVAAARMRGEFLSPLRIAYDAPELSLPVRLGLINSVGEQDLVIHIFSPDGARYEAANYRNMTVPTDVRLAPQAAQSFSTFYSALFSKLARRYPRRVFTEFAGPIRGIERPEVLGTDLPALSDGDVTALGGDLLPGHASRGGNYGGFVMTRLHYRYGRADLPDDLVFRAAHAIAGGDRAATIARMRTTARRAPANEFSARYVVRHRFQGQVLCASPRRGRWRGMEMPWGRVDRRGFVHMMAQRRARPPAITNEAQIPLRQWILDPVQALGIEER